MKAVTFGIIGAGRIVKLHTDNLLNRVEIWTKAGPLHEIFRLLEKTTG